MNNGFVDIRKAARLLGRSERDIRRQCVERKLPGAIKSKSTWKIPVSADVRLQGFTGPKDLLNSTELLDIPAGKREDAIGRVGLIQEFEKFARSFVGGDIGGRVEAVKIFAKRADMGARTLQRWLNKYKDGGLLGLVDTRGGGKFISQMISPEAFEYFKSLYLTQQQLTKKMCWQMICHINKSEEKGWKIPSYNYMIQYVHKSIPLCVEVLHREGLAAYEAKCAPYIQSDPDSVQPGQVWVGDHHQCNCWVRYRNKWVRPWLTAWLDMRSRTMVGWHINAGPNQTTVLQAMKRGLVKYGPPDTVKIDNGKDYDSEMWTGTTKVRRRKAVRAGYIDEPMVAGIYAMMDVGASFAKPYHPQSKNIERFFDTFDTQFVKAMPTYCGKDSARRPDGLFDKFKSERYIAAAMSLEQFAELVDEYAKGYNARGHTGDGMNGESPDEVMATRQSRRVVGDGVLDLLLRVWSGELIVRKNGVNFKKMWYGQYDMNLLTIQGKKVRVSYDPDDMRRVYVYDAVTLKLVTIADQNELIRWGDPVSDEALRDAMRSKARAVKAIKGYRDKRLTASMDLPTLAIRALAEGKREAKKPTHQPNIRPVATPLDGQVVAHEKLEVMKTVRKAVGSERTEVLDIDFTILNKKTTGNQVKLFND